MPDQDMVEVTTMGDTERKYVPILNNATAGWFGGTTTASTTNNLIWTTGTAPNYAPTFGIRYDEYGNRKPFMVRQPDVFFESEKPKVKSKNDPLEWLHGRVDEICELGYLDA